MSVPFWQPTDGQRRYYDRGAEQMGQAGQSATTWQQRARGDPAEALRQRYAELHGIEPVLHANPGTPGKRQWGRRRRTPRPTRERWR